jgi:cytoskeletal protein CcmA (bactofilin family)
VVVEGELEGDLFGVEQVILRASARVKGNLVAPRVALEDGATFQGGIDMSSPGRQSPAVPKSAMATQPAPKPAKDADESKPSSEASGPESKSPDDD